MVNFCLFFFLKCDFRLFRIFFEFTPNNKNFIYFFFLFFFFFGKIFRSIDGTDGRPHDRAILRAVKAKCKKSFSRRTAHKNTTYIFMIKYNRDEKIKIKGGKTLQRQHNNKKKKKTQGGY